MELVLKLLCQFMCTCLGIGLGILSFLLAIWIHELAHKKLTLKYSKSFGFECVIKMNWTILDESFHTESSYYRHLQEHRSELQYQKQIKNIAIAGYIASSIFLCILWLLLFICILFFSNPTFFVYWITNVLMAIIHEIYAIPRSDDLQNFYHPGNFIYKY